MTEVQSAGCRVQGARRFALHTALCTLHFAFGLWLSTASAQVGHDPARSPYRDLRYSQFLVATTGYFHGDGGQLGVGPHSGVVYGLRHDFLANGTVTIGIAGAWGRLQRNVAFPLVTSGPRLRGPVDQDVVFGEGTVQFNVAGGKTWHHLAPYIGSGIGLAFGSKTPEDTSKYKFRWKFYVAPNAGVRVFVSRRLYLRLEARSVFWNLSYPSTYTQDPDLPGSGLGPLLASRAKEWVPSGWYMVGLGYAFRRPFF